MEQIYIDRFHEKYLPEPNSGCWLWIAGFSDTGYGVAITGPKGKKGNAHRISYLIHNGEFDGNLSVLHKCDVRACVNPAHLFLGTQKDNMRDAQKKGRCRGLMPSGEKNPNAKLTDDIVRSIILERRAGAGVRALGRKYKIANTNISAICLGRAWKHVKV